MNEWRNQIMERVRVLFPVEKRAQGTFESARGCPTMNVKASMINPASILLGMEAHTELMQLVRDRFLLLFYHPAALYPRDISRCMLETMILCDEMDSGIRSWAEAGLPEPPEEIATLIFARSIGTCDVDRVAHLVPMEDTPWAYRLRATPIARAFYDDNKASPFVVIDASSPTLPALGRWLLSAPGDEDHLDEVLAGETLPPDVRERVAVYAAERRNVRAARPN